MAPPGKEPTVRRRERIADEPALPRALQTASALLAGADRKVTAVILVEGMSDRSAIEALARRDGRDLRADGVAVTAMGGVTNVGHFLDYLGPRGLGLRLAGLCDVAEERYVLRGLERAGYGPGLSRAEMEELGFYVCVDDLEDELIRALGVARVEETVAAEGELESFHRLQRQPAQRERTAEQQLHRFFGSRSGRKSRYAELLVDALAPAEIPVPLRRTLAHV